jgi:hypothetical protein
MEPIDIEQRRVSVNSRTASNDELDPQLLQIARAVELALAEIRKGGSAPTAAPKEEPKEEKKEKKPDDQTPLFWKLCSAALLSVTALIVVTLYNQLNSTASQLNSDVGQLRNELSQLRTDLVPKDDYNLRIEQLVSGIKDVQAINKAASENWRERVQEQKTTVADLRLQIKTLERELQVLREQLSILEQQSAVPAKGNPPSKERKSNP